MMQATSLANMLMYVLEAILCGLSGMDPLMLLLTMLQLRTRLDYSYHKVPTKRRQVLQDSLIDWVISQRTEECKACKSHSNRLTALFTAGAMASGKGHTLRHALKNGYVSLPEDFIWCLSQKDSNVVRVLTCGLFRVDPDRISRHLPEREQYLKYDQSSAPEKLHPEASMIQELLGLLARERKRSLVVDGSLSDGEWVHFLAWAGGGY